MRNLILTIGVLPYLTLAFADVWMHETKRRVPVVEKWLHLGIGAGIGTFLFLAFNGYRLGALAAVVVGITFMCIDEFGFHRTLSRAERTLHGAAAVALLVFVGVWSWTESHL